MRAEAGWRDVKRSGPLSQAMVVFFARCGRGCEASNNELAARCHGRPAEEKACSKTFAKSSRARSGARECCSLLSFPFLLPKFCCLLRLPEIHAFDASYSRLLGFPCVSVFSGFSQLGDWVWVRLASAKSPDGASCYLICSLTEILCLS